MVKIVLIFTVIAGSFFLNNADSSHQVDIQGFLKALQQQLKEEQRQVSQQKKYLYYGKDRDNNYYGSLKDDVENILSLSPRGSKKKISIKNRQRNQQLQELGDQYSNFLRTEVKQNYDDAASIESYEKDDHENQPEYSKVYVVLNSEAIRKSKNKNKINALLSSLLEAPPRSQDQDQLIEYSSTDHRNQHQNDRNRYQIVNDQGQDKYDQDLEKDDRYQGKYDRYQEKYNRYQDKYDQYKKNLDRYQNNRNRYDRYQDKYDRYQENYDRYQNKYDQYKKNRDRYQNNRDWHQKNRDRYQVIERDEDKYDQDRNKYDRFQDKYGWYQDKYDLLSDDDQRKDHRYKEFLNNEETGRKMLRGESMEETSQTNALDGEPEIVKEPPRPRPRPRERMNNRPRERMYDRPRERVYERPRRGRSGGGGGSGGGSGSGRTAIPYLNHRGDIYERESF